MPIIRWNPWSIDRFFDEDFELPTIPGISRFVSQGLNLYETDNEIVAEAALPGISEDKIDVTVDEGIVRIVGSNVHKDEDKKRKTFMSTLSSSYNYAFRLPQGVIADKEPACELSDGILTVHFSKMQKTPPKRLKITKRAKELRIDERR